MRRFVSYLRDVDGYVEETSSKYDKSLALVKEWLEAFLLETQPKEVEASAIFKELLFDAQIELRNRFLHIDYDYGTSKADTIAPLHRTRKGGAIKGAIKLTENVQRVQRMIENNPGINSVQLAKELKLGTSTIDRAIRLLKDAKMIEHRGSKKTGGFFLITS